MLKKLFYLVVGVFTPSAGDPLTQNEEPTPHDEHIGIIVTIGIFMLVGSIPMHLGLGALYHYYSNTRNYSHERRPPPITPVEIDDGSELAKIRSAQESLISNYDWVDKKAGIARIPIERAMEIMAEKAK